MKTIARILAVIFGVIMLLTTTSVMAQWTTIKASIKESDVSRITGQSYQNYKGITAVDFEIIAFVETVQDKDNTRFKLNTQSINMVKYYSYSYRPAPKLKNCIYGKLVEGETKSVFFPNEIGNTSFESAMRTANATFDVEITFLVKDKKFGDGYRATRIFKNVKGNAVFWADEPLESTSPIEGIKILNNPKVVSFSINDSGIQTAVLDFVKKRNQQAEDECNGKSKENIADKTQKDGEAIEKKVGGTVRVTANSSKNDNLRSSAKEKTKTVATNKIKATKDYTSFFNAMPEEGEKRDDYMRMIDHFNVLQERNGGNLPKDTPDKLGVAWHVDQDGNLFFSANFGEAGRWMTTNLAATTYISGEKITGPSINSASAIWAYPKQNGYSFIKSVEDIDYKKNPARGLLYSWEAATQNLNSAGRVQGICPKGWYLPTWKEWEALMLVSLPTGNYPVDGNDFARHDWKYGLDLWWSSTRSPDHFKRGQMAYTARGRDGYKQWSFYKPSDQLYHVGNSMEIVNTMFSIRCKCDSL